MGGMLRHGRAAPAGRFQRPPSRPISEINVTPFVDVMLVLLVIFMITAPLLATGVQVELPNTRATQLADEDKALAVTIDKRGRIFLQDAEITIEDLGPKLTAVSGQNREIRVFVRGDKGIAYGQVMAVLGAVYNAGYRKVALLTEPPGGKTSGGQRTAEVRSSP